MSGYRATFSDKYNGCVAVSATGGSYNEALIAACKLFDSYLEKQKAIRKAQRVPEAEDYSKESRYRLDIVGVAS